MKVKTISFNKSGYDGFIDFIKAYAILCVLFGHTFVFLLDKVAYGVWAGMQVPFFILIQTFHCYKKDKIRIQIEKVFKRVIIPFVFLEFLTFLLALCLDKYNCHILIHKLLFDGGFGPGSYFPWVYFQVAILLPIFSNILTRLNKVESLIVFLLICEGSEIAFSYIDISESFYRLLAVRYIFLFYLGWMWAKEGIKNSGITIIISIISLAAIIYFEYFSIDDEPWFFSTGFSFHRWPCYFFVAYGFSSFLYLLWKRLSSNKLIVKYIKHLASASYEIFLVQMSLLFLFQSNSLIALSSSKLIRFAIWVILVWSISIIGGSLLNKAIHLNSAKM